MSDVYLNFDLQGVFFITAHIAKVAHPMLFKWARQLGQSWYQYLQPQKCWHSPPAAILAGHPASLGPRENDEPSGQQPYGESTHVYT